MIYSQWFEIGPCGTGRTTALIKAAKEIGATFVCATPDAERLAREQDVPTIWIGADPRGTKGPYIFDHLAMLSVVRQYEDELKEAEARNRVTIKGSDAPLVWI